MREKVELVSVDVEHTMAIANSLASFLKFGDIILLAGDLGAGKTQFVKGCATALGYDQLVTSPSYTIAGMYEIDGGQIIHSDLYRINRSSELFDLGLLDYFPTSITFVEWGDKFEEHFEDHLSISFEFVEDSPNTRKLTVSSTGNSWKGRFSDILQSLQSSN